MNRHILHIEDELAIAAIVKKHLKKSGFEVTNIYHGDKVIQWFRKHSPDLVILDLTLPGCDGIILCEKIREFSNVPIIIVSDRVSEDERLLGLESGADDYVCKPFSIRELVARVKVILRRINRLKEHQGGIFLNEEQSIVRTHTKQAELTSIELNILKLLLSRPNCIFSRKQIMDSMYADFRINSERTVDSHMLKLRKKLNQLELSQPPIRSVYGLGFKYELPNN